MRAEAVAALLALLLVAFAASVGLSSGVIARSRATPTPTPTVAPTPSPSPTPEDQATLVRRAFAQPLTAGCATDSAVWLFADGGAAIRLDLETDLWSIPDPALRSLEAAACRGPVALAVGGGGSIVTADDDRRILRADRSGIEDLHGLALLPDGALAVGERGTVLQQSPYDWTAIGGAIGDDLYGVAVREAAIWVVGARGAAYRPAPGGWSRVATGTDATLRAVAIAADGSALAAGDAGTLLRWNGSAWAPLAGGTSGSLRAASAIGAAVWVVGDGGVALEIRGDEARRVDLATSCTLRSVFARGSEGDVWMVGSEGLRGGAWRVTAAGIERWGSC